MTLGPRLLGVLAERFPDKRPTDVIQRAFIEAKGNASQAARELKTNRQSLLGAVDLVGLRPWLEEAFPTRERGGAPRNEVPPELAAKVRMGLDGYGLSEPAAIVLKRRFDPENPWTLEELAGHLRITRQAVQKIERRALEQIALASDNDCEVDGSGLSPEEHARRIATLLALSPEQAKILLAELRNVLVPALHWAGKGDKRAKNGIARALRLLTAIERRARGEECCRS